MTTQQTNQDKVWQKPYVNVLKIHQGKPFKLKVQGDVKLVLDSSIGKQVYQLSGAIPAANYLSLPDLIGRGSTDQQLALTGHFLYIQLRVDPNEFFVFHIDLLTKDDQPIRVSFSNIYKDFKKTQKALFFTAPFLESRWTVLAVDLKAIISDHFNKIFKSVRGFVFCANMLFRNVYTSSNIYHPYNLARDMYLPCPKDVSWEELYDWHWFPSAPEKYDLAHIIAPETLPKPYDTSVLSSARPFRKGKPYDLDSFISNKGGEVKSNELYPNPIMKCKHMLGYSGKYNSNIVWSSNGKHIFYSCDSTIVQLNVESGEQTLFFGHTDEVGCICIDSKCKYLASAQAGKLCLIRIWHIESAQCFAVFKAHDQDVTSLAISDNRNVLVGVGRDKYKKHLIVLWDLTKAESGQIPIVTKYTSEYSINSIKFVPLQESKLVSCGDGSIRFWRIKSGQLRGCSLANENADLIRQNFLSLSFEKSFVGFNAQYENRMFISTHSGAVYEVNYEQRLVECVYQLHSGPINSIFVNEGMCVTGSDDKFIRVWPLDFSDYFLEAEHDSSVNSVAISHDGLQIAIGTESGSIGVLNLTSQNYQTLIRSHTKNILAVASDPHRPEFTTISDDETVRVWDLLTSKQLFQFDTAGDKPSCLVYHPSDYVVACGFNSGVIRLFDIAPTSVIEEYRAHADRIQNMCYSRDARWLISISLENICISDAYHRYQPIKIISFTHPCSVGRLSCSADGKLIASIGPSGNMIHLFSTASFDETHVFDGASSDTFCAIEFTPDCKEIVAITSDIRLVKFNVLTGRISSEVPRIHNSAASALGISKNGRYIVTGASDKIMKVWDNAMSDAQAFIGHSKKVNSVAFSNDMKHLVSVSDDCIVSWNFYGDASPDLSFLIDDHIDKMMEEDESSDSIDIETGRHGPFEKMISRAIFPEYNETIPKEAPTEEPTSQENLDK